jgi:hypothetical protein
MGGDSREEESYIGNLGDLKPGVKPLCKGAVLNFYRSVDAWEINAGTRDARELARILKFPGDVAQRLAVECDESGTPVNKQAASDGGKVEGAKEASPRGVSDARTGGGTGGTVGTKPVEVRCTVTGSGTIYIDGQKCEKDTRTSHCSPAFVAGRTYHFALLHGGTTVDCGTLLVLTKFEGQTLYLDYKTGKIRQE